MCTFVCARVCACVLFLKGFVSDRLQKDIFRSIMYTIRNVGVPERL